MPHVPHVAAGEDFPSLGQVPALRAGASALPGRGLCARRWRAVLGHARAADAGGEGPD